MLGHVAIQTVSMVSMAVACSVAGAQLDGWDSSSTLGHGILPASHIYVGGWMRACSLEAGVCAWA